MAPKHKQTALKTIEAKSRRNPRNNLRGRLNDNNTIIAGNEYNEALILAATKSEAVKDVLLAPGNNSGRANAPVNNVGRLFQQGVYLPGTKLTYIPSVGLNTAGTIFIGFLDNPTMIVKWNSLTTDSDRIAYIRDLGNVKTGPAWQELDYPLTRPPRRRVFSTDSTITVSSTDEIDISIQGLFLVAVIGTDAAPAAATKTVGQLVVHAKCRFEEIKSQLST